MAVASPRPAARGRSGCWATGDETGLPIPMDAHALREGGPQFLTEAFQAFGGLSFDNGVTGISRCDEVAGGSTGRKALLSIEYRSPTPHRDLFVKFSRDLEDPTRDHGRTQMASEVAFARLSRTDAFPVSVPSVLFADYELSSGTGILVTERIPFGSAGIEPQHAKCMDYEMPDPLSHYRALLGAVARLAGTDAAGRLPNHLDADMEQLSVGERPPLTAAKLERRVDDLADFAAAHPALLPAHVRSPSFLSRLRIDLPRLLEREPVVWQHLRSRPDFVALRYLRSRAPDLTRESTRMDPAIRDRESSRCRLQMMTNVLNLMATRDLGLVLDEIVG